MKTLGPWTMQPCYFGFYICQAGSKYKYIALVPNPTGEEEYLANLIVAAPEMLKALQEAETELRALLARGVAGLKTRPTYESVCVAIAKATGKNNE